MGNQGPASLCDTADLERDQVDEERVEILLHAISK